MEMKFRKTLHYVMFDGTPVELALYRDSYANNKRMAVLAIVAKDDPENGMNAGDTYGDVTINISGAPCGENEAYIDNDSMGLVSVLEQAGIVEDLCESASSGYSVYHRYRFIPEKLEEYLVRPAMSAERLKSVLVSYVENDLEAAESSYVAEVLKDVCGCSAEELEELGFGWLNDLEEEEED